MSLLMFLSLKRYNLSQDETILGVLSFRQAAVLDLHTSASGKGEEE
jgi:hypothetical protein